MSEEQEEQHLVVLARTPKDPARWEALVGDVAAISDTVSVVGPELLGGAPVPGESRLTVSQEILERAVGTPLLVLPASEPPGPRSAPARLHRILVPMDRSLSERRALRPLIERAQALQIDVHQLHVLGKTSLPAMWEGSGHHAEAWFAELRRRHQPAGTALAVVGGDPVERILLAAQKADLVMICWHCDASPDRAGVVRAVMDRVEQPLLLIPVGPTHPEDS
jgi:hypothetical protein